MYLSHFQSHRPADFASRIPPSTQTRFSSLVLRIWTKQDVVIEMASAFQLQKRRQEGQLSYRLLDDKDEQTLKMTSEFKWVEEHVRTLDLVLRERVRVCSGSKGAPYKASHQNDRLTASL